ncbi:MAG: Ig-like domain-containing protein [Mycobacterium leprae]
MKRKAMIVIAALLAVGLILGAVWFGFARQHGTTAMPFGQGQPAEVSLTPLNRDANGVESTSSFRLSSVKSLAVDQVKQHLSVQPAVAFKVEKTDLLGREFKLTPEQPLDPNKLYRFRLSVMPAVNRTYAWSFQTKALFRVVGSMPRNQATGVPLNTGIELTFSYEDYADPSALFTINPSVEGRFERHKKTLAFVPKDPLQPATVYTITLKKGLAQQNGPARLESDYTFAFETQATQQSAEWFYFPPETAEFVEGEAPYFPVGVKSNNAAANPPVDVKVFRYSDSDAFIAALREADRVPVWAYAARSHYAEETKGLERVASFSSSIMLYQTGSYLLFPETLKPGYYLADLTVEEQHRQIHFQVTNLASYTALSTNKTLVWLNDLATGKPLPGATVGFAGTKQQATTDRYGVALLVTPEGNNTTSTAADAYLKATDGTRESVLVPAATRYYWYYGYGGDQTATAQYWHYLYLDRSLYQPDDTVNLWGVLRPRAEGAAPATSVTAQLIRYDYTSYDGKPVELVTETIPVDGGTFTGSLSFAGLRPGWYTVQVLLGDEVMAASSLEVQTYTKPAYKLTVTPDKRAVFEEETMHFTVQASFFEGTPVPNLKLRYRIESAAGEVTTDESGQATIPFRPARSTPVRQGGGLHSAWLSLSAVLPEGGEISATSTVTVATSDVLMRASGRVQGDEATVQVQLNAIDLARLNAGAAQYPMENYTGTPVAGAAIEGRLVEQNWIREEDGEYYNFITKQVQKRYRYHEELRDISSFTLTTDAEGRASQRLTLPGDKSYRVVLTTRDGNGQTWLQTVYLWGGSGQRDDLYKWYSLSFQPEGKYLYGIGEEATLAFLENGASLPDRAAGFLFYTARFGIQSYQVQSGSVFKAALQEQDLPNRFIGGVWFDGRQYHESSGAQLRVDPEQKALTVSVTPDKPVYRPGDTVNLAVLAKDRQGQPVSAKVNLNLVDEALYALRDQSVNLVQSLYNNLVPSGILRTASSHRVPNPGAMAEKGGDGGGSRVDFRDAVFFETVTTDSQGKASASFRVPDNLTQWRLTYQALAPESLEAGSGTLPIDVKLPFFVDLVLGKSYLAGDQPALTMRSYGTDLQPGQSVAFAVTVTDPKGVKKEYSAKAAAFAPATVQLRSVTSGTYAVTVRGTAGSLTDSLTLPFTVVDSYLTQEKVDFKLLEPGLKIQGAARGITTLTFTDYDRSGYLRLLQELSWQWGNRLEPKLARIMAGELLQQYFDLPPRDADGLDPMAYQTEDGAIAILPYADADLKLSALAADLAGGHFDQVGLLKYFQKVLDDDGAGREAKALALYGLAAVDEPVLPAVERLLAERDLSVNEQLFLALAEARLGNLEEARVLYYRLLAQYGEQLATDARLKVGRDQDEIMAATALTAVLAGKLGEPEAPALVGYLLHNRTQDLLLTLEELLTAQAALANLTGQAPSSFTYLLNGQETTKDLKPGETLQLALTPAALASLQIKTVTGRVGLTAAYQAPLSADQITPDPDFTVKLSSNLEGDLGAHGPYQVGDVVRFSLQYAIPDTAPDGAYEVTAYLPSGMRLLQNPWRFGVRTELSRFYQYPMEVDGQKVAFWASKDAYPVVFYARVTAPGEYAMEEATLHHQRSGRTCAVGEREWVVIK